MRRIYLAATLSLALAGTLVLTTSRPQAQDRGLRVSVTSPAGSTPIDDRLPVMGAKDGSALGFPLKHYYPMDIPKGVERMLKTAPPGADLKSWRY